MNNFPVSLKQCRIIIVSIKSREQRITHHRNEVIVLSLVNLLVRSDRTKREDGRYFVTVRELDVPVLIPSDGAVPVHPRRLFVARMEQE